MLIYTIQHCNTIVICTNPRNKETCAVNSLLLRNCDLLWCCAAFWLILLCMLSLHVYLCLSPGSFWIWIKCSSTNGMDVCSVEQSRPQFKQKFWKTPQLFEGGLWKTVNNLKHVHDLTGLKGQKHTKVQLNRDQTRSEHAFEGQVPSRRWTV